MVLFSGDFFSVFGNLLSGNFLSDDSLSGDGVHTYKGLFLCASFH